MLFLSAAVALALVACATVADSDGDLVTDSALPEESVPDLASSLDHVQSYLRFADPAAALHSYQEAMETQPEAAGTQILLARLYLLAGDDQSAEHQLLGVLRDPFPLTPEETAEAHYGLSLLAASRGEPARQRQRLQEAVDANPQHSDALASLGAADARDGDTDSARLLFRRALQAAPQNVAALLGLGSLAAGADDHEEAIRYYDQANEAEPDHPFVYVDRAGVRRAQERYAEAIADMTRAIELEPEFSWHYLDRGRLYRLSGDQQAATADFGRAIELEPDGFAGYVNRGNIAYRARRQSAALSDYEYAIGLRPDYYPAYPYLGLLNAAVGDWARAASFFVQAAQYDEREPGYALLTGLSERFAGNDAADDELLAELRRRAPPDTWYYDVARLILEEANTLTLNSKYRRHRDRTVAARVMFYLGAVEMLSGHSATAQLYFLDAQQRTGADFLERNLAHFLGETDVG